MVWEWDSFLYTAQYTYLCKYGHFQNFALAAQQHVYILEIKKDSREMFWYERGDAEKLGSMHTYLLSELRRMPKRELFRYGKKESVSIQMLQRRPRWKDDRDLARRLLSRKDTYREPERMGMHGSDILLKSSVYGGLGLGCTSRRMYFPILEVVFRNNSILLRLLAKNHGQWNNHLTMIV